MKKLVVIACLALSIACREEDPGTSDAGTTPDAGAAPGLSCPEVLSCADACPDDACVDGCVTRASPEAITQVTALVSCSEREACGDDSSCLTTRCAAEIEICAGVSVRPDAGVVDAGPSTLPNRIEGTTRDHTPVPGSSFMTDSNATVVFVRDDAAGAAEGFPTGTHAFYRVEQITYRAVLTGNDAGCTTSADFTETFTNPPPLENHLILEIAPGSDGLHAYELSTGLSVNHPTGLVTVCPPPAGTSTGIFNAEHYVSSGTSHPRGGGRTFVGNTTLGVRNWWWDLSAVD